MSVIIAGVRFNMGKRVHLHGCSYLSIRLDMSPVPATVGTLMLADVDGKLVVLYLGDDRRTYELAPTQTFETFKKVLRKIGSNWELANTYAFDATKQDSLRALDGYDSKMVATGYIDYLCEHDKLANIFKVRKNLVDLLVPGMFDAFVYGNARRSQQNHPTVHRLLVPFIRDIDGDKVDERYAFATNMGLCSSYPLDFDAVERLLLLGETSIRVIKDKQLHRDAREHAKNIITVEDVGDEYKSLD